MSNYINHHQIPVSNLLYEELGKDYCFIQTEEMDEERKSMGWDALAKELPYVLCSYEQPEEAKKRISQSDVVIFGGCEDEGMIRERLEAGKPVLRYSERLYKDGTYRFISPRGLRQKYKDHVRFRKKPVYLLCAGGYVAADYHRFRAYGGKMIRFGYFPEMIDYGEEGCHAKRKNKETDTVELLWAGRFIDWKHPEMPLRLMKELKENKFNVHLTMVGGGLLEERIRAQIAQDHTEDVITLAGYMEPEAVRTEMEKADIFLFTSDYHEGWGVVLNEAMNSGCAVIANQGIGAVPYLLEDSVNGYVYPNRDFQDLYKHAVQLIRDRDRRFLMGEAAYRTIREEWNPDTAAKAILSLAKQLCEDGAITRFAKKGPGSKAPILSPGFWN